MASALPLAIYWERQLLPDSCRMHAVNAILGGPTYTWGTFLGTCDAYDAFCGLSLGTSRQHYVNPGRGVTLFGFALHCAGSRSVTLPLAMYARSRCDPKTPEFLVAARGCTGAFVYSSEHVWAMRPTSRGWVRIDSLTGVAAESLESVWRDGLCVELVFDNPSQLPQFVGQEYPTLDSPVRGTIMRKESAPAFRSPRGKPGQMHAVARRFPHRPNHEQTLPCG